MMRKTITPVAVLLGFFFDSALAAGIPVEDRSGQPATATAAPAQPNGAAPAVLADPASGSASTRLTPMASQAASQPSPANSAIGELLMMLDQLQQEVGTLRGQLEQQQHQMKRMKIDQRDRYRDLDRRLSLLNQQASVAPVTGTSMVLPASVVASVASPTVASGASAAQSPSASRPDISDSQAFKAAFALVRQGKFDQALQAFEGFLALYPDSSLTANVLYWTGEVHRAQSVPDHEKASQAYLQVVERYPSHAKVADAYYKLGLSYQGLGQVDRAKSSMNKVLELFPDQAPAVLARDFLKQHR